MVRRVLIMYKRYVSVYNMQVILTGRTFNGTLYFNCGSDNSL